MSFGDQRCGEWNDHVEFVSVGHKVIVFGRHLKMLCIVDECLQRRGIHPLHYNGSLNTQQREDALRAFTDESHNVILITVGAGGEGITITEADRIIIIDPNWNPTVDDQAIDRACVIYIYFLLLIYYYY